MLRGVLNTCRVQKMPYPPPIPLPVPTAVQPRPVGTPGLTLDALELMSDEEAQSNEQLYHSVWLLRLSRLPPFQMDQPLYSSLGPSSSVWLIAVTRLLLLAEGAGSEGIACPRSEDMVCCVVVPRRQRRAHNTGALCLERPADIQCAPSKDGQAVDLQPVAACALWGD